MPPCPDRRVAACATLRDPFWAEPSQTGLPLRWESGRYDRYQPLEPRFQRAPEADALVKMLQETTR